VKDWAQLAYALSGPSSPRSPSKPDVATRFRLRDRSLAEEIVARWGELPPYLSAPERLTAMFGEPVTAQQFAKLQHAFPDVLEPVRGHAELPKLVVERVLAAVNAPGRPSLDLLAESFNRDPELSRYKEHWTRGVVKDVVKAASAGALPPERP
jgi:hypothetical protein